MYRLVQFFKRYYVVFLFVLLEAGAISYYAHSTSYTRATLLSGAIRATGGVRKGFAAVGDYFSLRRENRMLLERLARLENSLQAAAPGTDTVPSAAAGSPYRYSTARVVSNSIARQDNFFVIDKGTDDGIEENMAILSPEGAVAGYVRKCSKHYAVCMSVLNSGFSIGGQLKGSEYFGSVYWNGTDPRKMTLVDIPRYASVTPGDSVLSAYSLRFPPDRFIGTVISAKDSPDGTYLIIDIRLGAEMNTLSDVLLVKYTHYEELNSLAGEHFADTQRESVR